MTMDRRSFNKTLAGLAVTLTLPFKAPVEAAAPVARLLAPLKLIPPPAHYGFTAMNITTHFDLEQISTCGQLELLEEIHDHIEPDVEMSFSFYLDREMKIERTVYFEGNNKKWTMVYDTLDMGRNLTVGADLASPVLATDDYKTKREAPSIGQVFTIGGFIEAAMDPTTHRAFYAANEIKVYYPDTHPHFPGARVSESQIKKDEQYTIKVQVSGDHGYSSQSILMLTDFTVTDIEDYNDDEMVLQGITK